MTSVATTILTTFKEYIKNTKEALKEAGIPEPLIERYTTMMPNYEKLLPEDVIDLYKDIFKMTVYYLSSRGFSLRKIGKELRCSHMLVQDILHEQYKEDTIPPLPVEEK